MSVYTTKTGITSILKPVSTADRERAKTAALNKVRFATPKEKGLIASVNAALNKNDFNTVKEFTFFLREAQLSDDEVVTIMQDARKIVHDLTSQFANVVEALLSLSWKKRSKEAVQAYIEFSIDVIVAHNTYIHMGVQNLIVNWIPGDQDADWILGCPSESVREELEIVHALLNRILTAVPMAMDVVFDAIAAKFPYFKRPAHVTAGFLYNVLRLIEYKPVFEEVLLQLVLQKLLVLDVNAPRDEIDLDEETDDEDQMDEDHMFHMEDLPNAGSKPVQCMKHPIAQTLDICLMRLYKFLENKCRPVRDSTEEDRCSKNRFFKMLLNIFENVLLPSHNTHHVQFVIFHVCSFKQPYAESFLYTLLQKVQNPNMSAVIRHAAVGYMASFLARAKYVPLNTITSYLKELCKWAHTYIDDSDEYSQNCTLKANIVFFSVCQAIFYLIAFRARDLTASPKNLLFLQSLQLSRLAMCHFNPLRYCLQPVATAFAGVMRTHQLAYCHTVLERNARRKLATVYGYDKALPEETLETFFPFDPYLLKLSNEFIEPNYLVYKVHELEEPSESTVSQVLRRKRGDSEMQEIDDFILPSDKRQKLSELSKSQEFDRQFHYGTSPGFNV
ncbi:RNA polymerase I-specific transcription initiation factor RRN3 [Scaptodrosophila lebanonensis]|uniref:RNA polymerase I-specific transcription initiation factor RRN3 n=1 Tax=Drosophila lebanonensis TaxID=7225 RepID=A0A6J2TN44_DROLE|nr:RNA polymerase I-specific transcription initiation factor RRN3 [Scaptodrosophila lebanonensis]